MRAPLTLLQIAQLGARLNARSVPATNGCVEVTGHALHSGHVQLVIGSPRCRGVRIQRHDHKRFARVRAHVFAWELAHAQDVPAGQVVMHTCDNPRCVNPDHLRLGTQGDNVRDSLHKGRYNAFGRQKLNAQQVIEIREQLAAGVNHAVIAGRYGVTRGAITSIKCGYSWRHFPRHVPPVTYSEGQR